MLSTSRHFAAWEDSMFDPGSVRFEGPLKPYVDSFWAELRRQGYSPLSAGNLLRVSAHFSRWLVGRRLSVEDLSEDSVAQFLAHRRREGYTGFLTRRALRPLLEHLGHLGIVIRRATVIETPIDRLVRGYGEYLASERCLSARAIRSYTDFAREFAKKRFDSDDPIWDQLTPLDVMDFVRDESRRWSTGYCKLKVTWLRSLLRFLHVRGHISRDLAGCVPAVAGWRLAWLPKGLEPDQVERLLGSADHSTAIGRRDAAIVGLVVRLGLRASDVAALELDHLDWRAGELVVCGKGRHQSRLPLLHDVGEAIAAYLRQDRPASPTRKVFLWSHAPYCALSPEGVVAVVRTALRRAGIGSGGARVLRQTVATQILRHGGSLCEVAHVLRHRHIDTTAIYAKVDLSSLQTLVRPWPGSLP
jgi:integrase/recombinase XerD